MLPQALKEEMRQAMVIDHGESIKRKNSLQVDTKHYSAIRVTLGVVKMIVSQWRGPVKQLMKELSESNDDQR